MNKMILSSGIVFSMFAVILGAFAAHGLKSKISIEMIEVFKTGVQYQFYHGLALILLSILMIHIPVNILNYSGYLFIAGVICFSGSLYALALTGIKFFGPITPLGGLFFIVGWILLLVGVYKT